MALRAAEQFGMPDNQALDYAKEVVLSDLRRAITMLSEKCWATSRQRYRHGRAEITHGNYPPDGRGRTRNWAETAGEFPLRPLAENPLENRIDVLGVICEVEHLFEYRIVDQGRHPRRFLRGLETIFPTKTHRIALNRGIRVFAAHPRLGQGQQNTLRKYQAAQRIQFDCICSIYDQFFDNPRQSGEQEIQRIVASGPIMRSTDECDISRSCTAPRFPLPGCSATAPAGQVR